MTVSELAAEVRSTAGPSIVAGVVGDGPGASQAQHAVRVALLMAVGLPVQGAPSRTPSAGGSEPWPLPEVAPGSPAYAAAHRFAALPASARHAWLVDHLAALRAGQITLGQLP